MVPRAGGAAPARTGPVGTTAGNRRRHTTSSSSRSSGGGGGQQMGGMGGGMLRFYTDDAPGLRITPVRPPAHLSMLMDCVCLRMRACAAGSWI